LSQDDRAKLRGLGVRFGAFHLFLPALLKPAATDMRLLLWWLQKHQDENVAAPPANGLTSTPADATKPEGFYAICGYRVCGKRAVRVDMLERLADLIRDRVFWKARIPEEVRPAGAVEGGGFSVVSDMMSLVGCSGEEFEEILVSLGFRAQKKHVPKPVPIVAAPVEPALIETVVTEAPVEAVVDSPPVETPPPEMIEINVWWPKDTGPFRKQPERPQFKKREKPAEGAEVKPKFNRRDKYKPNRAEQPDRPAPRPPRPEKPMDPNSPFAVLSALKAQMKQR
jgi:ATP-dependent RNA helicase SUPV3L1/SUV3